MIDPDNITNYNLNKNQLEEVLLFWVCAAGKTAKTASKNLEKLLTKWKGNCKSPFEIIKKIHNKSNLAKEMRKCGIGCYNTKSKTFLELANSNLDLKTCSLDDLENIFGIGPKTVRCYLIHSRLNQRYAGLDTHCLKYLKERGYDVPKSTPSGKKYKELEQIFLKLVDESGMNVADFDLMIWKRYSKKA